MEFVQVTHDRECHSGARRIPCNILVVHCWRSLIYALGPVMVDIELPFRSCNLLQCGCFPNSCVQCIDVLEDFVAGTVSRELMIWMKYF